MDQPSSQRNVSRWRNLYFAILLFFGGVNLLLLIWVVPRFEQLYRDALPVMVLPPLTAFIIDYRLLIALAVVGWMIFCGAMKWRRSLHAILWVDLGLIWTFLQIGVIVFALFHPMIGMQTGLGEGR